MTKTVPELLSELILNMKGLRLEIEASRVHTSSATAFILSALDAQISTINALKDKLK